MIDLAENTFWTLRQFYELKCQRPISDISFKRHTSMPCEFYAIITINLMATKIKQKTKKPTILRGLKINPHSTNKIASVSFAWFKQDHAHLWFANEDYKNCFCNQQLTECQCRQTSGKIFLQKFELILGSRIAVQQPFILVGRVDVNNKYVMAANVCWRATQVLLCNHLCIHWINHRYCALVKVHQKMIRLKFKFSLSKKIIKSYLMRFTAPQVSILSYSLHTVLFLKHELKAFMLRHFQNFGPC